MKTITNSVRNIFSEDEIAREAARRGILNNSAYAREIIDQIAEETWKEVEESSVTVSINRVSQEEWGKIKPDFTLDKISVESGLVDVTYERTNHVREKINSILPTLRQEFKQDMLVETSGQNQITMIMSQRMWKRFQQVVTEQPMGVYKDQVAITILFDTKYLSTPNFIYAVLGVFTLDDINLTEIFSTMTELVVVMNNEYLDTALKRLKKYMK